MSVSLIIAAGGKGNRFRKGFVTAHGHARLASKGKLHALLAGRPLLVSTIERFQRIPEIRETVIAVPGGMKRTIREWAQAYHWKNLQVVRGGRTRAESVWRALKCTHGRNPWVMVHDGARPLVPLESIHKLLKMRKRRCQAAILVKKVVPTIKEATRAGREVLRTIDRTHLYEAETPQLTQKNILIKAYRQTKKPYQHSDEAGLLEAMGVPVKLCVHEAWNPKITRYEDLKLAEAYASQNQGAEMKVGLGRDSHRLVTGRKLILGGVQIPFTKGALGHSDGDVLLHAVADAIWGVLGVGDIGEHFSDKDKKFKNLPSSKILQKALGDATKSGWYPVHVDSVITLEEPRLGPLKKKIKENLARLMKLNEEDVSVKAKTAEGLGPEGMGISLSCEALLTMRRQRS